MTQLCNNSANADPIRLPAKLSGSGVVDLIERARACEGAITLDGRAVKRVSTVGLGALLTIEKHCRNNGVAFALSSPSDDMVRHLTIFGAHNILLSQPEVSP